MKKPLSISDKVHVCKDHVDKDPEYFTAWEREFINDRYAFDEIGSTHSPAQTKQIERIYEKAQRR